MSFQDFECRILGAGILNARSSTQKRFCVQNSENSIDCTEVLGAVQATKILGAEFQVGDSVCRVLDTEIQGAGL